MADETKGVALAILGIVALIAIVGLVLLWMNARTTGQMAGQYYQGPWGVAAYDNPYHSTEAQQYTTYYRGAGAATEYGDEGTYLDKSGKIKSSQEAAVYYAE